LRRLLLLFLALALFPVPLAAQGVSLSLPKPSASPSVKPSDSTAPIAATTDVRSDQAIAARITGIFHELPSLAHVKVTADNGVVTLTGKVVKTTDSDRAEAIAGRVAGVATVENRIERDASLQPTTAPLESIRKKIDAAIHALPQVGLALVVALAISALGFALGRFRGFWRRIARNPFLAELLAGAVRLVFVLVGVVLALDMLGATALLGAVLGGAGVIGIALGFAMRDTIENYVASLLLSLRQPFRANDHVCIDTHEGRVIRLTSRATILMTMDGNQLRIPNSQVFTAIILNFSANPQRRFDFDLTIDIHADPTAARHLGVEALRKLSFVLADPAPSARVEEVGTPNIVLRFFGWVDQRETDLRKGRSRAIAAVKAALDEGGFALPEAITRFMLVDESGKPASQGGRPPAAPAKPPKAKPETAAEETHDVAPERAITQMVDAERRQAEDSQDKDKDLLDSSKPVE
jgi:small-conductance mechanosensitive channel